MNRQIALNILWGRLFIIFSVLLAASAIQHAKGHTDYGKLLFWSFVAGFNQNYVVDLIETMKGTKA